MGRLQTKLFFFSHLHNFMTVYCYNRSVLLLATAVNLLVCLIFKVFFIILTYNVLSSSAVQQSNSATHRRTFFFSHDPPSCCITSDQTYFLGLYIQQNGLCKA